MKKIFAVAILIFNIATATACDFCNCYLGLNPQYKKDHIGLRHQYMVYYGTHHDLSEFTESSLTQKDFWERRSILELNGQIYPTQKLQLIFSIPYVYNSEGSSKKGEAAMEGHSHGGTEDNKSIQGIGDPLIIAHYQIFNKTNMDSSKFSHRLFAGGGIKIPIGKYKIEADGDPLERSHQPGTGSWDFIASASYLAKRNRVGINLNGSYLITRMNPDDFQFGNNVNFNLVGYYQFNVQKSKLFPNFGCYYEQSSKNWNESYYMSNSGGTITYLHAGLDYYYKNISITIAFQNPIYQNLNSQQPEMSYRIFSGISYSLN